MISLQRVSIKLSLSRTPIRRLLLSDGVVPINCVKRILATNRQYLCTRRRSISPSLKFPVIRNDLIVVHGYVPHAYVHFSSEMHLVIYRQHLCVYECLCLYALQKLYFRMPQV